MSKSTGALKQAHDKLKTAVVEIVSGDDWKRMLKVASNFHRYSFNNQLMIFLRRPDATLVAGFHKWKSMGRCVTKGEKGIAIFAPCKYRTKIESDDGEEKTLQQIRGFRIVHVFDISQTEGEDLPDLDRGPTEAPRRGNLKASGMYSCRRLTRPASRSSATKSEQRTATATF